MQAAQKFKRDFSIIEINYDLLPLRPDFVV